MHKKNKENIPRSPFVLDHSSRSTLTAQMADALRQAIASGRYRAGEALPTVREWMQMLGVCTHVPEAALAQLVKEGLVVARPRHGCMVAPRRSSIFKGHVLLSMPPGDYVHLANSIGWQLTRRLEGAGYIVSRASSYIAPSGNTDFSRLRLALRQSVDVAVFIYESAAAAKCARQANVPFVTMGEGGLPGAMAHVPVDSSSATEKLVSECKVEGIHSVEIVEKSYLPRKETARAFMESGFKVKTTTLWVDPDIPRPESIMAAALGAFKRRFSHGVGRLPDLMLFDDNFLAQGAVPVLMQQGVKIPLHMQVAVMSTYGLGPAFPFPFLCMERNGYADGDVLADGVLAYFDKGAFPHGLVMKSRFNRRLS